MNANDLDARVLAAIREGARTLSAIWTATGIRERAADRVLQRLRRHGAIVYERREWHAVTVGADPPDLAARFAAWIDCDEGKRGAVIGVLLEERNEHDVDVYIEYRAALDAAIALLRGGTP